MRWWNPKHDNIESNPDGTTHNAPVIGYSHGRRPDPDELARIQSTGHNKHRLIMKLKKPRMTRQGTLKNTMK